MILKIHKHAISVTIKLTKWIIWSNIWLWDIANWMNFSWMKIWLLAKGNNTKLQENRPNFFHRSFNISYDDICAILLEYR